MLRRRAEQVLGAIKQQPDVGHPVVRLGVIAHLKQAGHLECAGRVRNLLAHGRADCDIDRFRRQVGGASTLLIAGYRPWREVEGALGCDLHFRHETGQLHAPASELEQPRGGLELLGRHAKEVTKGEARNATALGCAP